MREEVEADSALQDSLHLINMLLPANYFLQSVEEVALLFLRCEHDRLS